MHAPWTADRAALETPPVRVVCDALTPWAWGSVATTERWDSTHALVHLPWGDEAIEKTVTWKTVAWALEHDKALVLS